MKKEYIINQRPQRAPTHPGAIINHDILPALKMTIVEAAKQLHISRQTLHRILSEKASVTPEMALKLAKFCGNTPLFWLRMQQNFDLWSAEKKLCEELKEIPNHGELFHI